MNVSIANTKEFQAIKAYWYGAFGRNKEKNSYVIFLAAKLENAIRLNGGNEVYEIDLEDMIRDGYSIKKTAVSVFIVDSDNIPEKYVIRIINPKE